MVSPQWLGELSTQSIHGSEPAVSGKRQESSPKTDEAVTLIWGHRIPTRDGIKLNATVYRPQRVRKRLPVIFTLTPYVADNYHDRASYFARHGYVFALVDVRGRGNSEGEFNPWVSDGLDGYDIVEHFSRQAWCNGKVAMWGGSYAGFDQWATLKESPPHLETIVPAASAHPGVDFPYLNGVWYPYVIQWLTLTSGAAYNGKIFEDVKFWIEKFQEYYRRHLPYRDLDMVVGNPSKIFRRWLELKQEDWKRMAPRPDNYRRMSIPILTISRICDVSEACFGSYSMPG